MTGKGVVLVTGINGYIAARTAESLLDAGYSVRGTVRSTSKAGSVISALTSQYGNRVQVVEVADIVAAGAFDEAVKGVSAIAHLASPVSLTFSDPEPVLKAAIQGTVGVLESAAKEPSVKSVVLMSSIVAVRSPKEGPYSYTEEDWNDASEAIVAEQGKGAPGLHIYSASKTASERAFWKFRDERHPAFSMTSINPVFVAGPPLVKPTSSEELGVTFSWIFKLLRGDKIDTVFEGGYPGFVDVRDVGRLVVFGVDHPETANGERYIASAGYGPPQAGADVLRAAYPDRRDIIDKGTLSQGYAPGYAYPDEMVFDGSKAVKATGQAYIPFDKMVLDSAKLFEELL